MTDTPPSPSTPRGSSSAWRRLRQAYADRLTYTGSAPCWRDQHNLTAIGDPGLTVEQSPNCLQIITPTDPWVLGHTTDRALGGDDTELSYECDPCSRYTGGKLGALIRRAGARTASRTMGNIR